MAEALRDRFANIMTFAFPLAVANTLAFGEVNTNIGIDSSRKSGVAILIDQIDYFIPAEFATQMTANGDRIDMAITIANSVADLRDMSDRRILDSVSLYRNDFGTAASGQFVVSPIQHQFFPPLIMAERSIFLGCDSAGLAAIINAKCRIFYRTVQITAEEFVEIAEVFRLVS